MTVRLTLPVLLAVTLSAPAAGLADENTAFLSQGALGPISGSNNSALITQSAGNRNAAGASALSLQQAGRSNQLDILQTGDDNSIGLTSIAPGAATGFSQASDTAIGTNRATLRQLSDGNSLGSVVQDAQGQGASAIGNDLRATQGVATDPASDGNQIGRVQQTRLGAVQGNTADVLQSGAANQIAAISQSASGTANATANSIDLRQIGDGNGQTLLSGRAALSGALSGQFIQTNPGGPSSGNTLQLTLLGNGNQAGTLQQGTNNLISGAPIASVQGNDNQLGAVQTGLGNSLSLLVQGDRNDVGTVQYGVNNAITLTVSPAGSDNGFTLDQMGTDNTASVLVSGNLNTVSLFQDGDNNTSLFSTIGNRNSIDGKQDGSSNSATVTQSGDLNSATFSQLGGFNTITINQ